MQAPIHHTLLQQNLWLSAQRALFWEEEKMLVLSDLHFGKTGHFRKAGIAVPQAVYKEDLQRLVSLLHYFQPAQLLVTGDFFHSHANAELELFSRWRHDFPALEITLVRGNHDILPDAWYREAAIHLVYPSLQAGPFVFTHDQADAPPGGYCFSGHLHPGVVLQGLGRQSLRFPCFYFTRHHCLLPAFSRFTGAVAMDRRQADAIFVLVENELVKL